MVKRILGVEDCFVVGVFDERFGEVVMVVVFRVGDDFLFDEVVVVVSVKA